jgi:hypothetical protein
MIPVFSSDDRPTCLTKIASIVALLNEKGRHCKGQRLSAGGSGRPQ